MRTQNMYSNCQAPSRDIARSFATMDYIQYICDGWGVCMRMAKGMCNADNNFLIHLRSFWIGVVNHSRNCLRHQTFNNLFME